MLSMQVQFRSVPFTPNSCFTFILVRCSLVPLCFDFRSFMFSPFFPVSSPPFSFVFFLFLFFLSPRFLVVGLLFLLVRTSTFEFRTWYTFLF